MKKRNLSILMVLSALTFSAVSCKLTKPAEAEAIEKAKEEGEQPGGEGEKDGKIAVTGVNLKQTSLQLMVGESSKLQAEVEPFNATEQGIIWKSGDESVATVDANGKVTALKEGTVVISAVSVDGGKAKTCTVTVVPVAYSIKINNKEELQKKWANAHGQRLLNLSVTPAGNVETLVRSGEIKITSSDPTHLEVSGLALLPKAEVDGTKVTVSVEYKGSVDTVEVTLDVSIPEPAPIEISVSNLLKTMTKDKAGQQMYILKDVYVIGWQNSSKTDGSKYGNFIVGDTKDTAAENGLLVYGATASEKTADGADILSWTGANYAFINPQDFLTNEKTSVITIGTKISLKVSTLYYNDTPELNGIITAVEAGDVVKIPEPAIAKGKTVAEFYADTQGNGKQIFELEVKVSKWYKESGASEYGDMYVTATNDTTEYVVYGLTSKKEALKWNEISGAYSFSNPKDFLTHEQLKEIKPGDTLTVGLIRSDYKETAQGVGYVTKINGVEVKAETTPSTEIAEPALITGKSIADFAADTKGDLKQLYEITGVVCDWYETKGVKNTDGTQYGNFYINTTNTTEGSPLLIYGATATASALVWNKTTGAYEFTNPKDFLTNDATKGIKIGDTVKLKVTRKDFKGAVQGVAIITEVNGTSTGGQSEQGETHKEPALITGKSIADFAADTAGDLKQLYEITGVVCDWYETKGVKNTDGTQYGNFYINTTNTTEGSPLLIYGATATASALAWNSETGTYVFTNPKDFLTNDATKGIKIGDTVKLKVTRKDYKGAVQGVAIITEVNGTSTGGQSEQGETNKEPALVTGKSIADFAADTAGDLKQLYEITGVVCDWYETKGVKNTDGTQYGNFYINTTNTTEGSPLLIYGATATASALAWNSETGAYTFTNPKDFLTNAATKDIKIGDTVKLKVTRKDYKGAVQGVAIITEVNGTAVGGQTQGGGETQSEYEAGQTYEKTVEECLTIGGALEGGAKTEALFKVKGFVTLVTKPWADEKGISFNIATEKGGSAVLNIYGLMLTEEEAKVIIKDAEIIVTGNLTKFVQYPGATPVIELVDGKDFELLTAGTVEDSSFDPTSTETTLTAEKLQLGTSYGNYSYDTAGMTIKCDEVMMNGKKEIQTRSKNGKQSSIYNTTETGKAISSIVVVISGSTSAANTKLLSVGLFAESHSAAGETGIGELTANNDGVFVYTLAAPETFEARYFNVSHIEASGAVYISSITINYK